MSYEVSAPKEIPNVIPSEDRERLMLATTLALPSRVMVYEEMMERYGDSSELHPFLLVRLADMFVLLGSGPVAVDLYLKAQGLLSRMGIVEKGLNSVIEKLAAQVNDQVNQGLARSLQFTYHQRWKLTKDHKFPTSLPTSPPGSQEVFEHWRKLTADGSTFFSSYLTKLAIETNHIENTFLLTEGSTQDLVRRGISDGTVNCLPESAVQDPAKIKSILNDMLAAYDLLRPLVNDVEGLNKDIICRIHARLMTTCRFSDMHYIPAGKTRTETRKTVIVAGVYVIECCPFHKVDAEVEYICRMVKQYIKKWRNPFVTASWFHLILSRCHPFEDGNGRLVRLLASIPLMQHGYPPISIAATERGNYYAGIRSAYEGDHSGLVQCILKGMQDTIASVQSL